MTRELRVVGRPAVIAGMALTGLPTVGVEDATAAAEHCARWLDDPAIAVVLLEESLHDRLPDDLRRRLARRPLPMVVPFPGPAIVEEPEGADAYIVELLRQVIGYRVRLR